MVILNFLAHGHAHILSHVLSKIRCYQVGRCTLAKKGAACPGTLVPKRFRSSTNLCFCSDKPHDAHSCDMRLCPVTCDLCRRLCVQPHLHGLTTGSSHLCGSVLVPIKVLFKLKIEQIEKHIRVLPSARRKAYVRSTQPLYQ